MQELGHISVTTSRIQGEQTSYKEDVLAIEEPLEIRLVLGPSDNRQKHSLSITMRTPGHDRQLAAGFLFTEGVLTSAGQLKTIETCGPIAPNSTSQNTIRAELSPNTRIDLKKLQRHFYTSSSCGVCGKTSLEALASQTIFPLPKEFTPIPKSLIHSLPERLWKHQENFQKTGGLHAAALFERTGEMRAVFEDVGRHNALDKLIGNAFLEGSLPASDSILLVSGRASFELVQKAVMAGIPVMAAVGAPSSLAVQLAKANDLALLGFVRNQRFNCYSSPWRIQ